MKTWNLETMGLKNAEARPGLRASTGFSGFFSWQARPGQGLAGLDILASPAGRACTGLRQAQGPVGAPASAYNTQHVVAG